MNFYDNLNTVVFPKCCGFGPTAVESPVISLKIGYFQHIIKFQWSNLFKFFFLLKWSIFCYQPSSSCKNLHLTSKNSQILVESTYRGWWELALKFRNILPEIATMKTFFKNLTNFDIWGVNEFRKLIRSPNESKKNPVKRH